tara:strand:- start:822 stop:1607 length:786 start_codon:yes stop_codon:yes gene_type:complete
MVTFIICVKHYENCHSYNDTWDLLENTLVSVCGQLDNRFEVIVISNKTLNEFPDNPKIKDIKFIEVDWLPPSLSNAWQIGTQVSVDDGMRQIRLDRGTKYILGLSEVDDDNYVMFVDADDFIHRDLVRTIHNSDKDFLRINKGFKMGIDDTFKRVGDFNKRCGTCNITKASILKKQIDFKNVNLSSCQNTIIKSTQNYYLIKVIGSHALSWNYFNHKGYEGGDIEFRAAIYNCSHNEQHSGKRNLKYSQKINKSMKLHFNI